MRPNSQQGFSPVVRGVAQTNALVKVMQNGNVIYQENVPPGAFTLDSIQPTGSAGDLWVTVKEADGREQSFSVPFSAVPNMLKLGVSQYSVLAGKVNESNTDYDPGFVQGTLQYGFNNLVTGYAGSILSDDYQAWLLGSGWNLPIGAVSIDLTHADTRLKTAVKAGRVSVLPTVNFSTSPRPTSRWRPTVTPPAVTTALPTPFTPMTATANWNGSLTAGATRRACPNWI